LPSAGRLVIGPEESSFLADNALAFVFQLRGDGSPTGHPVSTTYVDDTLYFHTYRKSAKLQNILRDDRVCCLVVERRDGEPQRALLVRGRAVVLENLHEAVAAYDRIRQAGSSVTSDGLSLAPDYRVRVVAGKRAVLRIEPAHVEFVGHG
jgi:nitroimidazol reductase NimA-like FMN-containing flavoprotein (pyridoxamine 5'-phosphate oxidase superfamily)